MSFCEGEAFSAYGEGFLYNFSIGSCRGYEQDDAAPWKEGDELENEGQRHDLGRRCLPSAGVIKETGTKSFHQYEILTMLGDLVNAG